MLKVTQWPEDNRFNIDLCSAQPGSVPRLSSCLTFNFLSAGHEWPPVGPVQRACLLFLPPSTCSSSTRIPRGSPPIPPRLVNPHIPPPPSASDWAGMGPCTLTRPVILLGLSRLLPAPGAAKHGNQTWWGSWLAQRKGAKAGKIPPPKTASEPRLDGPGPSCHLASQFPLLLYQLELVLPSASKMAWSTDGISKGNPTPQVGSVHYSPRGARMPHSTAIPPITFK